jgi:hypothetical protein
MKRYQLDLDVGFSRSPLVGTAGALARNVANKSSFESCATFQRVRGRPRSH